MLPTILAEFASLWPCKQIDDEVYRLALRRVAVDQIMRDAFGPIQLGSSYHDGLYRDVKRWLEERHRLLMGLRIRFTPRTGQALSFEMSVTIAGRVIASRGHLLSCYASPYDRLIEMDKAYGYLVGHFEANLMLV
jgi:hypothetical protein